MDTHPKLKFKSTTQTVVGEIKNIGLRWVLLKLCDKNFTVNGDIILLSTTLDSKIPEGLKVGDIVACEYIQSCYWNDKYNSFRTNRIISGPIIQAKLQG